MITGKKIITLWLCTTLLASGLVFQSCSTKQNNEKNAPQPLVVKIGDRAPKWLAAQGNAMVIVDMQKAYMPTLKQAFVMNNIQTLIAKARAANAMIVWVYNDDGGSSVPGKPVFEMADPLLPTPQDYKVVKTGPSAFSGTELEKKLTEAGIGRLVFTGLASNQCLRATVESSAVIGFRTIVAEDAHTIPTGFGSSDTISRMNDQWSKDPSIELLPSNAIDFSPGSPPQ